MPLLLLPLSLVIARASAGKVPPLTTSAHSPTSTVTTTHAVRLLSTVTITGTSSGAVASTIAVTNTGTFIGILTALSRVLSLSPALLLSHYPLLAQPPHWHQGRPIFQLSPLSLGALGLLYPSLDSNCSSVRQDVPGGARRAGQGSVCNLVSLSKHAQSSVVPRAVLSPGHGVRLSLGLCSLSWGTSGSP